MRSLVLVSFVLLILHFVGCTASAPSRFHHKDFSPARIHEVVQTNYGNIQTMVGNGRIAIETPEFAQSGSFGVWVRKPDTVFVRLEGPFGIELGSALITRTGFSFYNSFQNQLITGSTTSKNLHQLFRIDLEFDEMVNLFTGGIFLPVDRLDPEEMEVTDDFIILIYRGETHHRRYWVEPHSLLIARIQHLDQDGKLFLEQRFQNYRTVGHSLIPYQMRITMPKDRRVISVSYSDVILNNPSIKFDFNVPQNAQRIRLQ